LYQKKKEKMIAANKTLEKSENWQTNFHRASRNLEKMVFFLRHQTDMYKIG